MSLPALAYDVAAAERRAERIRLRLDSIADGVLAVLPMIREAIEQGDHAALGYRSIGEYVQDRFGGALTRLPVDLRRPVVHELASAGLSTRAIAPVVGVSQSSIRDDLQVSRSYSPEPEQTVDPEPGEVSDDYLSHDATGGEVTPEAAADAPGTPEPVEPTIEPLPPVTGLDGKTYSRPEPRKPQRRSLVDDARDAGQELRKATERLQRIASDDRLTRNRDEVAAHLRHHLEQALTVCQDLSNLIN